MGTDLHWFLLIIYLMYNALRTVWGVQKWFWKIMPQRNITLFFIQIPYLIDFLCVFFFTTANKIIIFRFQRVDS